MVDAALIGGRSQGELLSIGEEVEEADADIRFLLGVEQIEANDTVEHLAELRPGEDFIQIELDDGF